MRARRSLVIAVLAVCTVLVSAFSASAAPQRYERYVALGDSYTAGPLIPLQRIDPVGCLRSTSNYPAQLALRLLAPSFTDVSCSGADTGDMTAPQSVPLGTNPPQLNALRPDTDLVTLGIGGNDYSVFGTLIGTCPGLRASDPTGNPCQRHFTVDGVDTIKAQLTQTQANITNVLAAIHQRSPQAKVLAVGYPRIAPPTGTCPNILPFADGDYAWLTSVEEALNDAISGAASTDGDTSYVDTFTPSLGHDACAGAAAWINGKDIQLTAAPYHPNFNGESGLAKIVYAALG
ncbi:SGNH/GDSL hydrolase family protein [Amycolatopsis acidiphila]|uniref:SGNH/GDSL hydrolase family protein n=1 Tax=Amycolatopsis acidiphila TaxID=715473 RepID=A0A558A3L9_9PSEU|nr:SGNH/GDSL hydrolase family protein [Amycolatopsis acidiphila]TVT18837.1 SGNH/GDSL hydrolase family protein [Amycolatopsis acidiphila]UIJ61759.1 SGNH/GDSL hydrolase family protein [Amycolatopsis acidiphila]GHG58025.1 lipase [Amycolatopsis acidiphila]